MCVNLSVETLENSEFSNMHKLVTEALKFVKEKQSKLYNAITVGLEKIPYEHLIARPELEFKKPILDKW